MFRVSQLLPYFTMVRNVVTSGAGVVQLCQNNPDRAALYISGPSGVALSLDTTPNPGSNAHQLFLPAGGTYRLLWKDDGILVTLAWYAGPPGPGTVYTVTELIWQPPTQSVAP